MAYNTDRLKELAIEAIRTHRLFFIEDVVAYLPCSKQTYYDHGLDEIDDIKELLEKNKIEVKVSMRSKWYKSDNPTLQMGLMKLLSNDTEFKRLANHRTDSDGTLDEYIKKLADALQPIPEAKESD